MTLESGDRELCLVLVAGLASVKTQQADFPNLGKRMSPFERTPPWSVYVPPQDRVEVTADSDLELAVCSAPGKGSFGTPYSAGRCRRRASWERAQPASGA